MAEAVTRPAEDPQLALTVRRVIESTRLHRRHDWIVSTVDDQQGPRRHLANQGQRPELHQLFGPSLPIFGKPGAANDSDSGSPVVALNVSKTEFPL